MGLLMMSTFTEYFKVNELKWVEIVQGLKEFIDTLKNERVFLLSKLKPFGTRNVQDILSNKDLSLENLIEHKTIIEKLIGEKFEIEDRHYDEQSKRKYFEKEVHALIHDWDSIRYSDRVKTSIMEVDI